MFEFSAVLAVMLALGVCGVLSFGLVWAISFGENRATMRYRSNLRRLVELMGTTTPESADDSAAASMPLVHAAEPKPTTKGRAAA